MRGTSYEQRRPPGTAVEAPALGGAECGGAMTNKILWPACVTLFTSVQLHPITMSSTGEPLSIRACPPWPHHRSPPPLRHPVIILGASGQVGRQAVLHALRSASTARVYAVGRSETPNVYPLTPGSDKLVHVPLDFGRLHAGDAGEAAVLAGLEADVVLSAFGTSRARAGGAEQFVRIDREFAVAGARAARVEGREQTLVYCSVSCASVSCGVHRKLSGSDTDHSSLACQSASADPTASLFYFQSKGLTEEDMAALGYTRTIILRPSTLIVPGGRKGEAVHKSVFW